MPLLFKRFLIISILICTHSSAIRADQVEDLVHTHSHMRFADAGETTLRRYAPSRSIDILHHKMDITPDFDKRSASGEVQITFKPIAKPFGELTLNAVELNITEVTSTREILGWNNSKEHLTVTFTEEIPADQETIVTIRYSVEEPEAGLYFRTPQMGYKPGDTHLWTQGETHEGRHWFPSYDYPNEKFTTEMICHVPEDMVALSNGRLISKTPNATTGLTAWHWIQEKPHVNYLITLCAGYFEKIEDSYNGVSMAFWAPPSQIDHVANSFAGTKEMMAFFNEETGLPYPWARYDQVVVDDFTFGGMENTTQTTLTDRTLFPDEMKQTSSSTSLVAHELAHQWFGDYVTSKDWSHIWLNEGFATYYDALYHEHALGRDEFLYKMLNNARAVLRQQNDIVPIVNRVYDKAFEQFGYRAYPKGSWILNMLRNQLGPDLYRECVKTYLERHPFGVVTTEDLVGVIEELSGRDWDQFFDQYVYHAHHPELDIDYSWDERQKLAKISIKQTQKLGDTVVLFDLPLTIRFHCGGEPVDRIAQISRASEDFYFTLPSRPSRVRIDPEFQWLAKIDFDPTTDMLFAQLADTSDVIGQIFAAEKLEKKASSAAISKLKQVVSSDPFWAVRLEAVNALKTIHTEESRSALLASTDQPDARVRRAIVSAIASYFLESTPTDLAALIAEESNPEVVTSAIRGLAPYPPELVRDDLEKHLRSESYKAILANAAIDAIRGQRDPAYLDILMEILKTRQIDLPSRTFANGLETVAILASELDDKTAVLDYLSTHLNAPKRSIKEAAIRAVGTLGDRRGIARLEGFLSADDDSPEHRAADAAIKKLREQKPVSAEVSTLRDEVIELQKSNKTLEEQFEELKKQFDAIQPQSTSPATKKRKRWFGRN